jgi:hypothetical protein
MCGCMYVALWEKYDENIGEIIKTERKFIKNSETKILLKI